MIATVLIILVIVVHATLVRAALLNPKGIAR